ncbi:HAD family hydrolase [Planifilum fimeticola]|jgi:Cof subfamily protein (haloacid dehalogenase superfamily)|nr:HAD family hydrolase [Planifilum fimeticola]
MLAYPFLVSDIDGTLLNNRKEIPPLIRREIAHYRQAGGLFTLATGRNFTETERFIRELDIDLPVILCNGALVYNPATRELMPLAHLSDDLVREIVKDMPHLSRRIDFFVYTSHHIYTTRIGPLSSEGLQNEELKLEVIPSFETLLNQNWVKIAAVSDEEGIKELRRWLEQTKLPFTFVQSSDHYYEILPPGVSKGAALQRVAEQLNLSTKQAAAIGDHLNDLPLFQTVGLSAAVSNAHPEVLHAADVIVPSNEEFGLSHFIQNHLFRPPRQAAR